MHASTPHPGPEETSQVGALLGLRRGIGGALIVLIAAFLGLAGNAPADIAFRAKCSGTGVATFDHPLTPTEQANGYTFTTGSPGVDASGDTIPDRTVCTNITINGRPAPDADGPVHAVIRGLDQTMSCATGRGTGAYGVITLANGVRLPFLVDFSSVLTEVTLTLRGLRSGAATGHASFAPYAPPTTLTDCGIPGQGIRALGFDAYMDNTAGPDLIGPGSYPSPSVLPGRQSGEPRRPKSRRRSRRSRARKHKHHTCRPRRCVAARGQQRIPPRGERAPRNRPHARSRGEGGMSNAVAR
jgi:hypothetical protein